MRKHPKTKAKEIFMVAALLLFLVPGMCAIYSGVRHAADRLCNPADTPQDVVFAVEYPFEGENTETGDADEGTFLKGYYDAVSRVTGCIDNYSGKNNVVSPFLLKTYGTITKALRKNLTDDAENPVIRLENGYLSYTYLYSSEYAKYEGILDFYEWLTEKNISFLAVIPADKSNDRYAVYPKGFPKDYSETVSEYVKYLCDNSIPYLSSEEILISENADYYSWFYKTDHHWNVHAGFTIAEKIAERLKTEFTLPIDTDVLNIANFTLSVYENLFLGSQGKKTTHGYIAPENFEVFHPLFDTSFSIEIPNKMIERTESFENTLIDSEALMTGDVYESNAYAAFLYGDVPLIRIHNLNCNNGITAFMLKTSEANVVDTYLAFTVEYLDIIDPRHFDGSIRMFIEKNHPDVVLTCAYPSEALDNKMLDIK